jgi:pimeloyl-ACP methyl ester carboxylesterase
VDLERRKLLEGAFRLGALAVVTQTAVGCADETGLGSGAADLPATQYLEKRGLVRLEQGVLAYQEAGAGEPLVFLHGLLVGNNLWRRTIPPLTSAFRCVAPALPLGSHHHPMAPSADLSPAGLATLVARFIEALGLGPVTLVANDTGGAIAQLVAVEHPRHVERLVLTNCDMYDNFLPVRFRYLQYGARVPGFLALAGRALQYEAIRRRPFGALSKRPIPKEVLDSYVTPMAVSSAIRRDLAKVLSGISTRYTEAAAQKLSAFHKRTLFAWAPEDRVFPIRYAEKLAAAMPRASLARIDDSFALIPEDQPVRLAAAIADFVLAKP